MINAKCYKGYKDYHYDGKNYKLASFDIGYIVIRNADDYHIGKGSKCYMVLDIEDEFHEVHKNIDEASKNYVFFEDEVSTCFEDHRFYYCGTIKDVERYNKVDGLPVQILTVETTDNQPYGPGTFRLHLRSKEVFKKGKAIQGVGRAFGEITRATSCKRDDMSDIFK